VVTPARAVWRAASMPQGAASTSLDTVNLYHVVSCERVGAWVDA